MRKRRAGNWLRGFQFFTSESESPDDYLLWTALAAISGAVQRRVYTKWVYFDFYPNIYVVLVGPPGKVHKSSTIAHARGMLRDIGVPTSSEAITKEALIEQMVSRGRDDTSAITVLSSELSSFIAPSGEKMVEFLTDIYDCPREWEYSTRSRGTEILQNSYLTILAGTTPSWISTNFDISFIDQGFASRTLFVYADRPRFRKAFADVTDEMWEMRDALVEDLLHISEIEGEFQWSEDGIAWFKDWYENKLPKERLDYRLDGYLSRKPTHIIRLGMLVSLADRDELILDERVLRTAKDLLDSIEPLMVRTFSAVGRNPYASDLERIAAEILEIGGMSKAELYERNAHAADKKTLDEILENLVIMKKIAMRITPGGVEYVPL